MKLLEDVDRESVRAWGAVYLLVVLFWGGVGFAVWRMLR